jgi:hypothetical protein
MEATAPIRTIRLGPDAYAYPDIDSAAWERATMSVKVVTDRDWRELTRAPAHGKRKHIDLLSQAPRIEVSRLDGSRDLEADCLQVLDELFGIAYRKGWRTCTLKYPDDVARDPDGPPVITKFMVSAWVTASSITIGKRIRRNRKRVSACIHAMQGLLDIDRQRTKFGKWRTRVRIVVPSHVFDANLEVWKKLSEDKNARRIKALQEPVKSPADLHERHASLERIDHGVAACDVGRFKVARSDRAATRRAAKGAQRFEEDFPESTCKGSIADQRPGRDHANIALIANDLLRLTQRNKLQPKWAERAMNHDPDLLFQLCNRAKERRADNPAGYIRSEWRRIQAEKLAGAQVIKSGKHVVHAPEDYDEDDDDDYGDSGSYTCTSDEATI